MKKRKKAAVDEGPWLFSEEEMAGKIENVIIVTPSVPVENEEPIKATMVDSENTESESSLFCDERMTIEMANVLREMNLMSKSQKRLIALTTTMIGQAGFDLSKTYKVPAISDTEISGYELTAWCYCSFMEAFPNMVDKLQMPYAEHYEKAKAMLQ